MKFTFIDIDVAKAENGYWIVRAQGNVNANGDDEPHTLDLQEYRTKADAVRNAKQLADFYTVEKDTHCVVFVDGTDVYVGKRKKRFDTLHGIATSDAMKRKKR